MEESENKPHVNRVPLECKVMPLTCPFCGCTTITVAEGSTFRWAVGECDNCGATCGEVRVNTIQKRNEDEIRDAVIEEWNKRHNVELTSPPTD